MKIKSMGHLLIRNVSDYVFSIKQWDNFKLANYMTNMNILDGYKEMDVLHTNKFDGFHMIAAVILQAETLKRTDSKHTGL